MNGEKAMRPGGSEEQRHGWRCPCYGCGEREAGCHGRCESYETYRVAQESAREKRHIVQEYDMAYDLYRRGRYPAIRRFWRRRRDP